MLDQLLSQTQKIVTIEDGVKRGGFGMLIQDYLMQRDCQDHRHLLLGIPEEIVPLASRPQLLAKYRLDEEGLYTDIRRFLLNR